MKMPSIPNTISKATHSMIHLVWSLIANRGNHIKLEVNSNPDNFSREANMRLSHHYPAKNIMPLDTNYIISQNEHPSLGI